MTVWRRRTLVKLGSSYMIALKPDDWFGSARAVANKHVIRTPLTAPVGLAAKGLASSRAPYSRMRSSTVSSWKPWNASFTYL